MTTLSDCDDITPFDGTLKTAFLDLTNEPEPEPETQFAISAPSPRGNYNFSSPAPAPKHYLPVSNKHSLLISRLKIETEFNTNSISFPEVLPDTASFRRQLCRCCSDFDMFREFNYGPDPYAFAQKHDYLVYVLIQISNSRSFNFCHSISFSIRVKSSKI